MTPRFRIAQLASTVASCSTKQFRPPTAPFRRHASWRSGSSLYENAPFPQARRTSVLRPVNFLVCLVPIFTFSLGIWQVKRLRWKVDLIDEVQRNIEREPMVLPPNINIAALPDFAFRRVLLKGVIANPPLFLGPIVEHGAPGSYIIQPFIRSDGSTVLLNRGFVTVTRADAIRAGKQVPQGMTGEEVIVEGMISKKFDEGKGWWAHDNEPENNLWFWKDIKGMAEWVRSQTGRELGEVQPVLVDAIDRGEHPSTMLMQAGIPVGRPPTVELRNQHATYAMTWFSLSFATAGMLAWLLTRGAGKKKLPKVKRWT